jgi:hypothetical protein
MGTKGRHNIKKPKQNKKLKGQAIEPEVLRIKTYKGKQGGVK